MELLMRGRITLPIIGCVGLVVSSCSREYREEAFCPAPSILPPNVSPTNFYPPAEVDRPLGIEVKAALKIAFSKAADTPDSYRIRKFSVYQFEQKIRYRIEMGGSDGSIWRAFVEKPEPLDPSVVCEVMSITKIKEPLVIFSQYALDRKIE